MTSHDALPISDLMISSDAFLDILSARSPRFFGTDDCDDIVDSFAKAPVVSPVQQVVYLIRSYSTRPTNLFYSACDIARKLNITFLSEIVSGRN